VLSVCQFRSVRLNGTQFVGANLSGASPLEYAIAGASFGEADLSGLIGGGVINALRQFDLPLTLPRTNAFDFIDVSGVERELFEARFVFNFDLAPR
jgi:uncharacterized protein YjbI with pentapeptide repeats